MASKKKDPRAEYKAARAEKKAEHRRLVDANNAKLAKKAKKSKKNDNAD